MTRCIDVVAFSTTRLLGIWIALSIAATARSQFGDSHYDPVQSPLIDSSQSAPSEVGPSLSDGERSKSHWAPPLPEGMIPLLTGKTKEEHRNIGLGVPLNGSLSWNAMSHSAGFYVGGVEGTQTIDDTLEHLWGTSVGLRFGVDYDYHWGIEKRFGFATMDAQDSLSMKHKTEMEFGDVNLYFYPWGDSLYRPYLMTGVGLTRYNHEAIGQHVERYLFTSPFGIGLKRLVTNGVDFRVDLADNLMMGRNSVGTMNNLSVSAGVEFRYSGFNFVRR